MDKHNYNKLKILEGGTYTFKSDINLFNDIEITRRNYKLLPVIYYSDISRPPIIICFFMYNNKLMLISDFILHIQLESIIIEIFIEFCMNYNEVCSYYHIYFPCFSTYRITENLSINEPMFIRFYPRSKYSNIDKCNEWDDPPFNDFNDILNGSSTVKIKSGYKIYADDQYSLSPNIITIQNNVNNTRLIIFEDIGATDNTLNNLCYFNVFINSGTDENERYAITPHIKYAYLKVVFQEWANYQNIIPANSSFGMFRSNAIQWLHYKQKDETGYDIPYYETERDYYNIVIKPLFATPEIKLHGGLNNIKQQKELKLHPLIDVDVIRKNNIVKELTKYVSKNHIHKIYDLLDNNILDKYTYAKLYNDDLYRTILIIYEKYANKYNYYNSEQFISKLNMQNISICIQIKNYVVIYGKFSVYHFNEIENINKIKFSQEEKIKIINLIKIYFPECII